MSFKKLMVIHPEIPSTEPVIMPTLDSFTTKSVVHKYFLMLSMISLAFTESLELYMIVKRVKQLDVK